MGTSSDVAIPPSLLSLSALSSLSLFSLLLPLFPSLLSPPSPPLSLPLFSLLSPFPPLQPNSALLQYKEILYAATSAIICVKSDEAGGAGRECWYG